MALVRPPFGNGAFGAAAFVGCCVVVDGDITIVGTFIVGPAVFDGLWANIDSCGVPPLTMFIAPPLPLLLWAAGKCCCPSAGRLLSCCPPLVKYLFGSNVAIVDVSGVACGATRASLMDALPAKNALKVNNKY